tara:strand:+ start:23372 stop:23686 length:315 start_codon:yes stop_codon:yes gene_type:complete
MIELFLVLSVCLNLFGFIYVRWVLRQFNDLNDNLKSLFDDLMMYGVHVDSIHQTEMYYGDSTLKMLIDHTKELTKQIEEYKDYLFPGEETDEYEANDDTTTQEN